MYYARDRSERPSWGWAVLVVVFAACGDAGPNAQPSDISEDAGPSGSDASILACDRSICIRASDDDRDPARLIDVGPNSACFLASGLAAQPAPRIYLDGVELSELAGRTGGCIGGTLAERTPHGEIWIAQGTDTDGDGDPDPGTEVESNRLQLVTQPWVTDAAPAVAAVGEPIVLRGENLPPVGVPIGVWVTPWCSFSMDEPIADAVTVRLTSDTLATSCGFELVAGDRRVEQPDASEDAPFVVSVAPAVDVACATRAGTRCTLVGSGFGGDIAGIAAGERAVALHGAPVEHTWEHNTIDIQIPADTPPGTYDVTLTRSDGATFESTATVLGWGREGVDARAFGFATAHEGLMADVPVGYIVDDGTGAFATRTEFYVGHGSGFQGWGPVDRTPADPESSFTAGHYGVLQPEGVPWQFDPSCGRTRFTIVPPFENLLEDMPNFLMAGERQGHCPWEDDLPPFPIDIGVYFGEGRAPGFQFSELLTGADGQRHALGGVARFIFESDPPRPDPDGRPGRFVPVVAINDLDAETTELFRVHRDGLTPHLEGAIDGVGTLHEAGEVLYLAGGDEGFSGRIHEVTWNASRPVPPPIDGLTAERMPHFAGARDGSLWTTVVTNSGVVEVHRWSPGESTWSLMSTIPDSVPGADGPGLANNPAGLGFFDMAVFDGVPVVAAPVRTDGNVDVALYAPDDDGEWGPEFESVGLWHYAQPCGGWVPGDDPRNSADCPPNRIRLGGGTWTRLDGSVTDARLWSADDAVWLRHVRTDPNRPSGGVDVVARPLLGRFGR